jgi:hypothetical protein
MFSGPDIFRLITGRIQLAPLQFVPTEHETAALVTAFATLEALHDRVTSQQGSDETEAGSLLGQLRTARANANISAEAANEAAAALKSLEKRGLTLNVRFAERAIWDASGCGDVLITVRRQPWAAAKDYSRRRSRR